MKPTKLISYELQVEVPGISYPVANLNWKGEGRPETISYSLRDSNLTRPGALLLIRALILAFQFSEDDVFQPDIGGRIASEGGPYR